MKRTTRNPIKSKQEIIEKAGPVFNTNGIAGTSMQMLVDATGFQMGGIYRHFDSKRDLAQAVFQYNFIKNVKSTFANDIECSPREKLLYILDSYTSGFSEAKVDGGCPIINMASEVDDTDDEFRKVIKSAINEILDILIDVFDEGKRVGQFHSHINSRQEALYMFSAFEGSIILGRVLRSSADFISILEGLRNHLVHHVFRD